jgi:hypothetical protein
MRKMYLWSCSSGGGVFCNGKTGKKTRKVYPPSRGTTPEEAVREDSRLHMSISRSGEK